jgi:hypothetical protein
MRKRGEVRIPARIAPQERYSILQMKDFIDKVECEV